MIRRKQTEPGRRRARRSSPEPIERPAERKVRAVLLVEADPDVQVRVARALRAQGRCVVGTSSGDGALALISQWDVDLALISQDLPGRAGVEVARTLKERRPELSIVLVASANENGVSEAAREVGAIGFLHKPLTSAALEPYLTRARPLHRAVPSETLAVAQ